MSRLFLVIYATRMDAIEGNPHTVRDLTTLQDMRADSPEARAILDRDDISPCGEVHDAEPGNPAGEQHEVISVPMPSDDGTT